MRLITISARLSVCFGPRKAQPLDSAFFGAEGGAGGEGGSISSSNATLSI